IKALRKMALAVYKTEHKRRLIEENQQANQITPAEAKEQLERLQEKFQADLPHAPGDIAAVERVIAKAKEGGEKTVNEKWGMLGMLGINKSLTRIDNAARSRFIPYGLSGIMLGASLVFFAYIGFDSISTHSEEARNPQRDVPFGILASLAICT